PRGLLGGHLLPLGRKERRGFVCPLPLWERVTCPRLADKSGEGVMSKDRLFIFDTTLRDGAQTQGVDFSVEDKRQIALALDGLGVDYIEGGWPGANPTDTAFFAERLPLKTARFTAFGMTKRSGRSAENDPVLAQVLGAA